MTSGYQDTAPTPTPAPSLILNLLLSSSTEECVLHHDRLFGELSLSQNFVVVRSQYISVGSSFSLVLGSIYLCLLTDQGPQFINVDSWAEALDSSLSGNAAYQFFQSNLSDIC